MTLWRTARRRSRRTPRSPTAASPGTSYRPPSRRTTSTELNKAVKPATDAGITVEYGGGAGQIGQQTDDKTSEIIGLSIALLLLLLMFHSLVAAGVPLIAAVFSVGGGLALLGWLASASTFPTAAPTVATLLGLGVAVDYGLFLVARHREQIDHGMSIEDSIAKTEGTSGAAIVVAGGTVVIAILGLYVSGVPFVGAMGLASAIVVAITVMSALTLVPAMLSAGGQLGPDRCGARRRTSPTELDGRSRTRAQRLRALGSDGQRQALAVGHRQRRAAGTAGHPGALQLRLGQLDAGTDPTSETDRRAYDLISEGFGPGQNGPITVVVEIPKGDSASDAKKLLDSTQKTLAATKDVAAASPPTSSPSGKTAIINVIPKTSPQDAKTRSSSTTCATTSCPASRRRPISSAPPPATSTSPSGSPSECRT